MSNINEIKKVDYIRLNNDWKTAFVKFSDGTQNSNTPFFEKIKVGNRETTVEDYVKRKQNEREKEAKDALMRMAELAEQSKSLTKKDNMFFTEYLSPDFIEKLKKETFGKYKITTFTLSYGGTHANMEMESEVSLNNIKKKSIRGFDVEGGSIVVVFSDSTSTQLTNENIDVIMNINNFSSFSNSFVQLIAKKGSSLSSATKGISIVSSILEGVGTLRRFIDGDIDAFGTFARTNYTALKLIFPIFGVFDGVVNYGAKGLSELTGNPLPKDWDMFNEGYKGLSNTSKDLENWWPRTKDRLKQIWYDALGK